MLLELEAIEMRVQQGRRLAAEDRAPVELDGLEEDFLVGQGELAAGVKLAATYEVFAGLGFQDGDAEAELGEGGSRRRSGRISASGHPAAVCSRGRGNGARCTRSASGYVDRRTAGESAGNAGRLRRSRGGTRRTGQWRATVGARQSAPTTGRVSSTRPARHVRSRAIEALMNLMSPSGLRQSPGPPSQSWDWQPSSPALDLQRPRPATSTASPYSGRGVRILTVMDGRTKKRLAIRPDFHTRSCDVIENLADADDDQGSARPRLL